MSKNDNHKHNDAADYLAQVNWENEQVHRRIPLPWHMIPKWRYKKVILANTPDENKIWRSVGIILILVCAGIGYFAGIKALLAALFGLLFVGVFITLIILDATKKPKDND
jgi:hypothetical protein